jgi:hypothetical protein
VATIFWTIGCAKCLIWTRFVTPCRSGWTQTQLTIPAYEQATVIAGMCLGDMPDALAAAAQDLGRQDAPLLNDALVT